MKKIFFNKKIMQNKKAFTLVELIVVITILAILATI
jgi:prepilin-type N-terminal cleavage/methylation domain-containing protein